MTQEVTHTAGIAAVDIILKDLRAQIQEGVTAWNQKVREWREQHGDKPLPEKAFHSHPAMNALIGTLALLELNAGALLGDEASGSLFASPEDATILSAKLLANTTSDLRKGAPHFRRAGWACAGADMSTAAVKHYAAHLADMIVWERGEVERTACALAFQTDDVREDGE